MSIYFNTIIPISTFLEMAERVMIKYNVNLYVEKQSINGERKRRYYETKHITENDFADKDYSCFFFSTKIIDLTDKEIILESEKVIYNNWFSFYDEFSIEGTGGRENKNNIENIHLRQIYKEPDKQIKKFYNELQISIKGIENIKHYKQKSLGIYYLETEKKMWSYYENQIPSVLEANRNKQASG